MPWPLTAWALWSALSGEVMAKRACAATGDGARTVATLRSPALMYVVVASAGAAWLA